MKSKFMRILALILVMSSLLSMFAIFASAEEAGSDGTTEDEETSPFELIYHRTYDEGWDIKNGMGMTGGTQTTFDIDHESTLEGKYNYFWRMTLGTTSNEYVQIPGVGRGEVGSVIEFDMMTDDITSVSNPVIVHTKDVGGSSSTVTSLNLMKIVDNKVYLLGSSKAAFTMESSKWYRIQLIFDYTEAEKVEDTELSETFKLTLNYGPADGSSMMKTYNNGPVEYIAKSGNGIRLVRFQSTSGDADYLGDSLCFDNVKYYEGTNKIEEITSDMGYGTGVKKQYAITEEILGGSGMAGTENDLTAALSMKVGVNYAFYNKAKTPIFEQDGVAYGAPVKINGQVMVPLLMVLKYIGFSAQMNDDGIYLNVPTGLTPPVHLIIGKDTANMGDKTIQLDAAPAYCKVNDDLSYIVIALSDVEKLFDGYYTDYDDMGYMVVSKYPDMIDRKNGLSTMLSIMKQFVFDYYTGESLYEDVKAYTNFEHPYLLASGERLNTIKEEYWSLLEKDAAGEIEEGSEEFVKLRGYNVIVENGLWAYRVYSKSDANGTYETFNGLRPLDQISSSYSLEQTYKSTGGYDEGGRSNIANRTALLEYMAQAYVLTEDIKYLQSAYEVALHLGAWEHWGPGHFLNCADSSNDFAIYYDWTYQGYVQLAASGITRADGSEYDVKVLADILARQGVHEGYLSTNDKCDHISEVVGMGGSSYSKRTNNWAAVCVGGMTVASLAILDGNAGETYLEEAKFILGKNLMSLMELGMDIYAPDGAYIEGPGYWNYGTNNFFRMCAALDSAAGTNYGLMDCWGIDTTCYYACHTEDNNSKYFPFHDGSVGNQDTSYFFYVAEYFNDATLYDARYNQIAGGTKNASILDFIYYPQGDINADDIQLDYYSSNIDLFATRSSWEKDALFASMIGGNNNVSHGQIDAGDFVYHNGGNIWIYDLGTENYNCTGFWPDATRYRYYVMKPEGNNTIAIAGDPTGTPYGQVLNAEAQAYAWGNNEHGSYVTYDMGSTLGPQVMKWERGMLLTNDRKTTVIQDQINFKGMNTVYWFAHYHIGIVDGDVTISKDGRTAYMRDLTGTNEHGEKVYKTLRLTIVSPNKSLKFQKMTTYQFIHTTGANATYSAEEVSALGGAPENSRENYRKLAISSGETLGFEVAVVIEMVDDTTVGKKTEIGVGYEYQKMTEWVPTADMRGLDTEVGDTVEKRGKPNADTHLVQSINRIKGTKDTLYTTDLKYYFDDLCNAYYAVYMIGSDMHSSYDSYVADFEKYFADFSAYRNSIIKLQKNQTKFVNKLMTLG